MSREKQEKDNDHTGAAAQGPLRNNSNHAIGKPITASKVQRGSRAIEGLSKLVSEVTPAVQKALEMANRKATSGSAGRSGRKINAQKKSKNMEAEDSAEDLAADETVHGGDTPDFFEADCVEEPAAEIAAEPAAVVAEPAAGCAAVSSSPSSSSEGPPEVSSAHARQGRLANGPPEQPKHRYSPSSPRRHARKDKKRHRARSRSQDRGPKESKKSKHKKHKKE